MSRFGTKIYHVQTWNKNLPCPDFEQKIGHILIRNKNLLACFRKKHCHVWVCSATREKIIYSEKERTGYRLKWFSSAPPRTRQNSKVGQERFHRQQLQFFVHNNHTIPSRMTNALQKAQIINTRFDITIFRTYIKSNRALCSYNDLQAD
jgi:hypothetical protein